MRQHGPRTTAGGLGRHDHGCLVYDSDATFSREAVRYLRDGLAQGHRAMYVGSATPAVMRAQLAPLGDVGALVDRGALELVPTAGTYHADLDLDAQAAVYEAAVDRALADGFAGLRTLAEMTELLSTPERAAQLVRWEARGDRIMAERPWGALCCYDRRRLPDAALGDVAAVHPVGCGAEDLTSFHLFCPGAGRLALSGDVDAFSGDRLERALDSAAPAAPFVLDLDGVEFVDHTAVLALSRRDDVTVSGAPYAVTRVAEVMGVSL